MTKHRKRRIREGNRIKLYSNLIHKMDKWFLNNCGIRFYVRCGVCLLCFCLWKTYILNIYIRIRLLENVEVQILHLNIH